MLLASLVLPVLSLAVPSLVTGAQQDWERVLPGHELVYPADHGAHPSTRIEWWYLTGQLESEDGRRFGFQFTVFRRGMATGPGAPGESPLRARQILAGHMALTDVENGRTLFAERLRRTGSPLARAAEDDLELVLEDWSLWRESDDRLLLAASDAATGIALELELTPAKALVLHGERGYSSKGGEPGNASAYSSWPRLGTTGRIRIAGEQHAVHGESWFDHEFGTSVLEPGVVGWDWFGLQLEDGRELMLFLLRREDGTHLPASAGTLIEADGRTQGLGPDAFRIESVAEWSSPRSGATYPARWQISIPSANLALEVVPLVSDCELGTARTTGVAYWEGPVEIRGTAPGRGYAELTGYAGSMEGRF